MNEIGTLRRGVNNCITDVDGVAVGHETLYERLPDGSCICTGVTAILPHRRSLFHEPVVGATYVINGFGKTVGTVQVDELGTIEAPIMLTNTLSVGAVLHGAVEHMLETTEAIGQTAGTVNVVVGECNDSRLNSIRLLAVTPQHAKRAIRHSTTAPSPLGNVGAGMGMVTFGHKGGVGTSSRVVDRYVVGVLVVSNFGKAEQFEASRYGVTPSTSSVIEADGSIMVVIATDAPLDARQLKRLAKRAVVGISRTGSTIAHGSGDIVIAFSTAHSLKRDETFPFRYVLDSSSLMNELFQAVAEATEEAIIRSMFEAETVIGANGATVHRYPFPSVE